ncbi:hypothetical protein L1987_29813 [Smallanthus sonchifolius]|uniref:Uncharacterized protein n=1 Tax=Smallanthus sonchifolius TaxID=185202 RepID=A0ACB9I2L8_9ASTR|nr:hypothetical protein L1987_29813 [Smallanthus sonchifolius]
MEEMKKAAGVKSLYILYLTVDMLIQLVFVDPLSTLCIKALWPYEKLCIYLTLEIFFLVISSKELLEHIIYACICVFFSTVAMEKSKKRTAVASSKLGAAEGTNRDKVVGVGDLLDKSQQSYRTQVSKLHPTPVMKRKFQKTASPSLGPGQKASSVYNLRSKVQITEGAPSYNLRSKAQKTENQNALTNSQKRKIPKKDGFKDPSVAIQTRGISKNSAQPNKKIETTKPLNAFMADLDKKNHPLTSQYEPFVCEPFFHIRWEGDDMENGPLGQKCMLCNKDLSGATEDDDDSEYNEGLHYEDDDYYDDDDDEYYDDINPPLLPAVDILSCGHAYHTECLQKGTPEERSSDPQCVLCLKMA